MNQDNERYMRKKEAASYLRLNERTLSRLMIRKAIPFMRLSRRVVLFDRIDLDRMLQKYRVRPVGEG